jgi:predicted Zn-dependent peptidase
VPQEVYQHVFANGLTLLAERMEHVRSAALNFLVPAGCVYDPPDQLGIAAVLADLITRGAGSRNSRELTLALDNLGLDHREHVGSLHTRFWGATVARNLPAALELYADILLRPHLPEEEVEAVLALAAQDLRSLEDEPSSKVMVELRRHHFPRPLSNDHRGTEEGLAALNSEVIRRHYRRFFTPRGTILSVAGNFAWEPLRDLVGRLFDSWQGEAAPALAYGPPPSRRSHVLKEQVEQTQIGLAYPTVPIGHPDYYAALGAVHVLSASGMSSRLFTEIREKRGLCYSVGASYSSFKDRGTVFGYAGTTNDRAQETLDLMLHEIRRLADGIDAEEVQRMQVGLKTALIMQQESTSARAASLASDWYYLGRVRSFDEIQGAVEALTPETILAHLHRYPPHDFAVVTLGPRPLQVDSRQ